MGEGYKVMEVKIEYRGDNEVRFVVSGSDVNVRFVNSLRRAMIAEVPKLAIDEVKIYENNSLLYDEQLALRLGLIPLKVRNIHDYSEEDKVTLTLKAESPERAGYTKVYSKELISSDPGVEPAFENIPIVKLVSKEREISGIRTVAQQRVSFEAIARLGRGKEHAKWQPVTICTFKELPQPNEQQKSFLFTVESDGSLPVDDIVVEAARILRDKFEWLVQELKAQQSD